MRKTLLVSVLSLLVAAPAAMADEGFVKVPAVDGKRTDLKMKMVRYDGSTNGEMVVVVSNRGKRTETFDPTGIYFVPDGDPETAPQRLGAAGRFKVKRGNKMVEAETIALKPGETRELHLSVFCIDSHRSSPSSSNRFGIAQKRMPKKLRQKIKANARRALAAEKSMPAAKGRIQSDVWKARDSKWIKLEGERKNEKAPRRHHNRRDIQRPMRQKRHVIE